MKQKEKRYKQQMIDALTESVKEQERVIIDLIRHQSSVTRRSVDEYLDALKSGELVATLQSLLDRATEKISKVTSRRNYWRWRAENGISKQPSVSLIAAIFLSWFCHEIEQLKTENAALRKASLDSLSRNAEYVGGWTPSWAGLPNEGDHVLVCVNEQIFLGEYNNNGWLIEIPGIDSRQPAEVEYWLALPEPPQQEESEE